MNYVRYLLMVIALLQATPVCAYDLKLSPLHRAAYINDTISLRTWIDKGEDVNAAADDGVTPLHIAAYEGKKESVQLLLERGANPNLKDRKHRTPLDLAFLRNHTEIAGILIPLTDTPKKASSAPASGGTNNEPAKH